MGNVRGYIGWQRAYEVIVVIIWALAAILSKNWLVAISVAIPAIILPLIAMAISIKYGLTTYDIEVQQIYKINMGELGVFKVAEVVPEVVSNEANTGISSAEVVDILVKNRTRRGIIIYKDSTAKAVITLTRQRNTYNEIEIDGKDSGSNLRHKIQMIIPGSEYLSDKYSILKDADWFEIKAILNETLERRSIYVDSSEATRILNGKIPKHKLIYLCHKEFNP